MDFEEIMDLLPSWEECSEKVDSGIPLTGLEQFIYDNTPAGTQEEDFRIGLGFAIENILESLD